MKETKGILNYSRFIITLDNKCENYIQFKGNYVNEEKPNEEKNITYERLIELRERISLTKSGLREDNGPEELLNLNNQFCERVNEIEIIKKLLKKTGEKDLSEDININININESKPNYCIDKKKFKNFKDLNKYLDEILLITVKIQNEYYKNEELLRFIYGRQFNIFNSCLKKKENNGLKPILKFLTNDQLISDEINNDYNYDYDLDDDKYIYAY